MGCQTDDSHVAKKKQALDAIRSTSVHNRDDLVLIVTLLQHQNDAFKVLCGCVALEKFLDEEARLHALNYHLEQGSVRIDPDLKQAKATSPHRNHVKSPAATAYQ